MYHELQVYLRDKNSFLLKDENVLVNNCTDECVLPDYVLQQLENGYGETLALDYAISVPNCPQIVDLNLHPSMTDEEEDFNEVRTLT